MNLRSKAGGFAVLLRGPGGRVLLPIALSWAILVGIRMTFPMLIPFLREDFQLSLSASGLLITVIWIAYALGQSPAGILIDKRGERTLLLLSMAVAVSGLSIILLPIGVWGLYAGAFVFGLGLSIFTIARITALFSQYPERMGGALGLTMATGDFGQSIVPPIIGTIAVLVSWKLGLIVFIPPLLLLGALLWFSIPPKRNEVGAVDKGIDFKGILSIMDSKTMIIIWIIQTMFILFWQTFSAFYPTYLIEIKGLSPTRAGILFGLFFAVGIVGKPLAGTIYDSIGAKRPLIVLLLITSAGLFILPLTYGLVPLIFVTIIIGMANGSGAITQPFIVDVLPEDVRGSGLGLIRSSATLVGASGPVLFGIFADFGFFDAVFVVLGFLICLGMISTMRL